MRAYKPRKKTSDIVRFLIELPCGDYSAKELAYASGFTVQWIAKLMKLNGAGIKKVIINTNMLRYRYVWDEEMKNNFIIKQRELIKEIKSKQKRENK